MASPFPGMDPYLEHSEIWPDFHHSLADEIKRRLNHRIGPKYYANVEIQAEPYGLHIDTSTGNPIRPDVSLFVPLDEGIEPMPTAAGGSMIAPAPVVRPAVMEVRLRAVRIFSTNTSELVTAIEILSPCNKRMGEGLEQYRFKRRQILHSRVHLIELDLLRDGVRAGKEIEEEPFETEYILLVNRATPARLSEIWPVALNEPLPTLPVPLLKPDPDVPLAMDAVVSAVYADSGYNWRINYHHAIPLPPLRPTMLAWFEDWRQTQTKFQA